MRPRMQKQVLALAVLCFVLSGGQAYGQREPPATYVDSLETMTAHAQVIVRGKIVGLSSEPFKSDKSWNVVSLKTTDFLKGDKTDVVRFAVIMDRKNKELERRQDARSEILCFLGKDTLYTDYEDLMARDKIKHFANERLSMFVLGAPDGKLQQPLAFNSELRLPTTQDEFLKEVRAACAAKPAPEYRMELPGKLALRSGINGYKTFLALPRDERLEKLARRLVETPDEFLEKGQEDLATKLRLEGIKALRLFPTEKNLAIINTWRETNYVKRYAEALVPQPADAAATPVRLPQSLATVSEVHLQQPLAKDIKVEEAQLRTACTIDMIHFHNQKKTDGFVKSLTSKRPDLAGLPFVMGDACRMKEDASRRFVDARMEFQVAQIPVGAGGIETLDTYYTAPTLMEKYVRFQKHPDSSRFKLADTSSRVPVLMQMVGIESVHDRLAMANYFDGQADAIATCALAKLAIFSQETEVCQAAVRALKLRRDGDYTDILLSGLNYPWPQVAERTAEAIVQLGRTDLLPQLIDVLDQPDPRAPRRQELNGKQTTVVRELVRINHHHNCLLCHAPATAERDKFSKEETAKLAPLTAQVPVPSEAMNAYYSPNVPDILVRFDVTYLRQDFSLNLPVAKADPWPEMQRYDFLVRTREVTEKEASAYRELLQAHTKDGSPYRRAAQAALRQLTGRDAEATAAAWRMELVASQAP